MSFALRLSDAQHVHSISSTIPVAEISRNSTNRQAFRLRRIDSNSDSGLNWDWGLAAALYLTRVKCHKFQWGFDIHDL